MVVVRRIHLYSGLFMFPWVLLYGVTGMFFNHPQAFTGGDVRSFQGADVAEGKLTQLTPPDQVAAQVVAAINASLQARDEAESSTSESGGETLPSNVPRVKLTSVRTPEYDRFFQMTVTKDDTEHTVIVDPLTGDGQIRTKLVATADESETNPLENVSRVDLDNNVLTTVQETVPAILSELELPAGEASTGRLSPSLMFSAEVDEKPCVITYNLGNGSVSVTPENHESDMNTKSFLQRLHLSRGYAPSWGIKSLWGILVDVMFVSMVFWGLSGLFMWWQIKRTRWLGTGLILASAASAAFLVAGMHDQLTMGARRGRGGGNRGGPAQAGGGGHNLGPRATDEESDGGEMRGNRGGRGGPGGNRGGFGGRSGNRGGRGSFGGESENGMPASNSLGDLTDDELDALLEQLHQEPEQREPSSPNGMSPK